MEWEVSTHCKMPMLSFKTEVMAGEIAQRAKYLLHKCGDLSLNPQDPHKVVMHARIPSVLMMRTPGGESPEACRPGLLHSQWQIQLLQIMEGKNRHLGSSSGLNMFPVPTVTYAQPHPCSAPLHATEVAF